MFVVALLFLVMVAEVASLRLHSSGRTSSVLKRTLALRAGESAWDSHIAVDQIPASLVSAIEGNESMRRKFEELCRNAQVSLFPPL